MNKIDIEKDYYTVKQTILITGLKHTAIMNYIHKNMFTNIKYKNRYYLKKSEIDFFVLFRKLIKKI